MTTHSVPLGELVEFNPTHGRNFVGPEVVSFLGMADVSERGITASGEDREYSAVSKGYTPFRNGDILVAKITPCFQNGKIAQARINHDVGAGSTEFHVVRPRDGVDGRYVLRFLRQEWIRREGESRMTGSGGQRRVPEVYLRALKIPFPPLAEQKRIAAVLDQVDTLRAKRRAAIALLDDLAHSIFLDMFDDPDEGWLDVSVGELAVAGKNGIRTGPFGSQLLREEFTEEGVAVLGIDNAVQNKFAWSGRRFISADKYRQLARYKVYPGDLLITIMGTCGRCAVVPDDIQLAINTKHLCCITLDKAKCLPEFLHSYFLMHPVSRRYLAQTAKGAIMAGLNMGIIKALPVRLPPLDLQKKYVSRVEKVRKVRTQQEAHLATLDELFESLQQRAFAGRLWDHEAA